MKPQHDPMDADKHDTPSHEEAPPAPDAQAPEEPVSGAPASEAPPAEEPAAEEPPAAAAPAAPAEEAPPFQLPPRVDKPVTPQRLRKSHVAPALLPIDRIEQDETFRLRPEGELSLLATDIARLGQLFPIDVRLRPPDRFQVVCGFRRLAALKFLQRDKVLARLHTDLSDEDALLMALADAIHGLAVRRPELETIRARLEGEGRLGAEARDMLEKALAPDDTLAPESPEEEVDAEELATDVTMRLGDLNQDLAALADVFVSLDTEKREALLQQLRYSAELVAYLEGL